MPAYYLHTNGELIYRAHAQADDFDSNFVKAYWWIDIKNRADAWKVGINALAKGAKKERVFELKEKWNLTDDDAKIFAQRHKPELELYMDGNQWCVRKKGESMPECFIGFGDTALEALAELSKQMPIEVDWLGH